MSHAIAKICTTCANTWSSSNSRHFSRFDHHTAVGAANYEVRIPEHHAHNELKPCIILHVPIGGYTMESAYEI